MHAARLRLLPIATSCLLALVGCATSRGGGVAIRGVEPGEVELGATRRLVILDGEGRRSARAVVNGELVSQARQEGYFTVQDRSGEGHTVEVVDRRVDLDRGLRRMPAGQAGLRVDIVEWKTEKNFRPVTRETEEGGKVTEHVRVRHGTVVLGVTLFDKGSTALMADRQFEGHSEVSGSEASRATVLERAARDAVANLLRELTPRVVIQTVPLDADDPGQQAIVGAARSGAIAQAADDATRYLQAHPGNPGAAYNLAVLLDALGRYEEALALYDRALGLGGKPYYADARAGCARRRVAQEALSQGPMPASLRDDYLR